MGFVENIIKNAQAFSQRLAEQNGISEYVTVRDDGKKAVVQSETQRTLHTGLSDYEMNLLTKRYNELQDNERADWKKLTKQEFGTALAVTAALNGGVAGNILSDKQTLSDLSRKFVQAGGNGYENEISAATNALNEDYALSLRDDLAQQLLSKEEIGNALGNDADWSDSRNRRYMMEVYDLKNQFRAVDKYCFENFECNNLTGQELEVRQTIVDSYDDNNPYEFIGCNEVYGRNNEFVGFCEPRLHCAEDASFNPVTMDNIIRPSAGKNDMKSQAYNRPYSCEKNVLDANGSIYRRGSGLGTESVANTGTNQSAHGSLSNRFDKVIASTNINYDLSKNATVDYE